MVTKIHFSMFTLPTFLSINDYHHLDIWLAATVRKQTSHVYLQSISKSLYGELVLADSLCLQQMVVGSVFQNRRERMTSHSINIYIV